MSDIDSSLILKRDRRSAEVDSNADDNTTVEESSDKANCADGDTVREQNSQSPISKKVKHSDEEVDGEEEAEF